MTGSGNSIIMYGIVDCTQGLKNVARKTARVNPDLIDVDLVRGMCIFTYLHIYYLCNYLFIFFLAPPVLNSRGLKN